MNSPPFVIYALFLTAGITLCSGLQSLLTRCAGSERKVHLTFAALSLCVTVFQLATAGYYLAETVPQAVLALHWQLQSACLTLGLIFFFVALQTGQRRIRPWLQSVALLSASLMVADLMLPYGLRFESLELGPPLHLPWGELLGHVYGVTGFWRNTGLFALFWAVCLWGLYRSALQYRAGQRGTAALLGACISMMLVATIWGACIDLGLIRSFYVAGFSFLGLVLLMSISLGMQQAQTVADLRTERDRLQVLQRQFEETVSELRGERDRLYELRQKLEASEFRMRLVLTGSNDAWWDWQIDTGAEYYSPRGWEMLGYADQELPYDDKLWERLIYPGDFTWWRRTIRETVAGDAVKYQFELRMRHKDGHPVPVLCRGYILRDAAGRAIRVSGTDLDLTAQKAAEARTHRLAYFDELSGLPNRRLLLDRLAHALDAAKRSRQYCALIFLDLDNFKHLNDARGHAVGDSLLVEVSQRLSALLRADDTVARLGGDEFVVIGNHLGHDIDAAAHASLGLAEKIRSVLERPFAVDGCLYSSTGSIGLTMFPKPMDTVDNLLREADTAMYRAKALGRNRIAYYESAMQREAEERLALRQDLQEAIDTGQICIYVQSQVDSSGTEIGGELLLRWTHHRRGPVSPRVFIPVAEESGLILKLGAFVLRQACEALTHMEKAGVPLSLSVNISPRQFRQDDFVASTRAMVQKVGAPASRLIFEVTEGLLVENWEDVASRMNELCGMGVRFSIDDFGTGYSSLAYLKRLPLHEIKIDKTFVQNTPADANDRAIVKSILGVAKAFRLHVVAEGVETQAQADFLARQHCACFQGFLFAPPEPLQTWLTRRMPLLVDH